jgi:hypothetical protein
MTHTYEPGDYVKAEFPDPVTGIGEWMWVRVMRRDDEKQIIVGTLDNEPVGDYEGNIKLPRPADDQPLSRLLSTLRFAKF